MIFIIHYPKHYVQSWQISSFTSLFMSIQVHLSCWFTSFFHSFLQNIALRSHLPAAAYMSDHNTKPMAFLGFNSNSLFPWCILSSRRYYLWCKDWAMIHRHKNLRHRAFVLKKISASYKGLPSQGGEPCRHGDPLLQNTVKWTHEFKVAFVFKACMATSWHSRLWCCQCNSVCPLCSHIWHTCQ